jgi:hypothetical protein
MQEYSLGRLGLTTYWNAKEIECGSRSLMACAFIIYRHVGAMYISDGTAIDLFSESNPS